MARKFAQIHVNIWTDEDFKALTVAEQHMYFVLLSQPRLNLCGVLDYFPARWALCVYEWTVDEVEQLVKSLEQHRYVVVDRDSGELLLRTFVRNDGLLRMPNVAKGAAAEFGEIMSNKLRDTITQELKKAYKHDPQLPGWKAIEEVNPVLYRQVTGKDK